MTFGFYESFPANIHRIEHYNSSLSTRQLQQKLIRVLHAANGSEYSFEEVANPTVPHGRVIFEFGLADSGDFNFIDEEEVKRTLAFLARERLQSMDFFCSIRYYKVTDEKRTALKFDYYMLRAVFSKDLLEVQVHHERGPRYLSPEELVDFIEKKVNGDNAKKILKKTET